MCAGFVSEDRPRAVEKTTCPALQLVATAEQQRYSSWYTRERLHLSRAKTLMSKMHADHLERDFYEARVGITARLARVCCAVCFSFLALPRDWHMLLTSRTHYSMHDDDNKLSLHATIMHIAVYLLLPTTWR